MRVKYKPWAKDYIEDKNDIFINSYIDNNNLTELLDSYDEVHMEIGCGKGKFIYENAKRNPNILYIGVERQASVIVTAAQKQEDQPLNNLKFYYGDIFNLKDNNLLVSKLDKIYLNFSDPWPKKRHIKRRLTFALFLDLYYELLKHSGEIEQKTDNDALFEYSVVSMANHNKWEFIEVAIDVNTIKEDNITTEYEDRFNEMGITSKYINIRKKND